MSNIMIIPYQIIANTVDLLNSVYIVPGVTMWSFTIALFIVSAVCALLWRSGKY